MFKKKLNILLTIDLIINLKFNVDLFLAKMSKYQ